MSSQRNWNLDPKPEDKSVFLGSSMSKVRLVIVLVLAVGIGFMIGILIGKFALCDEDTRDGVYLPGAPENLVSEADPSISKKIMDAIDPARIEANLRTLSEFPHIAGQQRDFDLVKLIKDRFTEDGLLVQVTPYEVLLSYPSLESPNSVRLLDGNNTVIYDAKDDESNFSSYKDVVPPFNAYSPSRLVEGKLVYAGYGRVEDYEWLLDNNINVSGRLVIVKYGLIFRGDKVDIAARYGAVGIIIYSDPEDFTGQQMGDSRVYPETWWLPPTGAQRGTIFTGDGDPITPGYPANDLAYHYAEDSVEPPMPQIPCHPIGYGAAQKILEKLGGLAIAANSSFHGGLNITYSTGPDFQDPNMTSFFISPVMFDLPEINFVTPLATFADFIASLFLTMVHNIDIDPWTIQLNVTTSNQRLRVENVFGIIKGTVEPGKMVEPDRYVIFGNHRDAWIYGAIDPSSGTAVMMEMARVMGTFAKSGEWRPRRSIIFCSWAAEEYGLIGSTEWVEQYVTTLRERTVAYVNVDIAVQGNDTLTASATPLMYNIIYDAAQQVKNPNPAEVSSGRPTVYDTWVYKHPSNFSQGTKLVVPKIGSLGSGSDYAPLLQRAGITALDLRYTFDPDVYKVSSYPLYHTEYETFDMVKEQFDKDFEFHAAVARVGGEMVRVLADSLVIPFNISNYAALLETNRQALQADYGLLLESILDTGVFGKLQHVIHGFASDVSLFESNLKNANKMNPYALREINDQIMLLEKAFLHPEGLPKRPLKKHLIFAENSDNTYAGSSFPGLVDLLFNFEDDDLVAKEQVRKHFHTILNTIQTAGFTLRETTKFMQETL